MMTSPASTPTQPDVAHPQYLVLVFDVCSSTIVLEDLSRSQSVWRWRQLLADLLKYISNQPGVIVYKFVGDGWFILMPHDIKGDALISFCSDLISTLSNAYEANIKPVMENPLTSLGLTIGIDSGTL